MGVTVLPVLAFALSMIRLRSQWWTVPPPVHSAAPGTQGAGDPAHGSRIWTVYLTADTKGYVNDDRDALGAVPRRRRHIDRIPRRRRPSTGSPPGHPARPRRSRARLAPPLAGPPRPPP